MLIFDGFIEGIGDHVLYKKTASRAAVTFMHTDLTEKPPSRRPITFPFTLGEEQKLRRRQI